MILSLEQFRAICPRLPLSKAELYLQPLNQAMEWAEINTKRRIAFFMGQFAHETAEFRYLEEIASGDAYEPTSSDPGARRRARNLGNTQPGDGRRYKGRGIPQLTGRANYKACGEALSVDLINHPELAATIGWAFMIGAWFWKKKDLNRWADYDDFLQTTKVINGGTNGLASRKMYRDRALQVLT